MTRRPKRRTGRSDEERRKALQDLQRRWDTENRRHLQTVDQLRRARALLEERLASRDERRRAEDRIRDEYHDSHAKTVNRPKKRT